MLLSEPAQHSPRMTLRQPPAAAPYPCASGVWWYSSSEAPEATVTL